MVKDSDKDMAAVPSKQGANTKGPWEAVCVGSMDDGTRVYEIHGSHGRAVVGEYLSEADARLIAAAPELLEALIAVLTDKELIYTGAIYESLDTCGFHLELRDKIRAVLAKL